LEFYHLLGSQIQSQILSATVRIEHSSPAASPDSFHGDASCAPSHLQLEAAAIGTHCSTCGFQTSLSSDSTFKGISIRFFVMQRFCVTLLFFGIFTFTLTESRTLQQDLDELADIQRLVSSSRMRMRGWTFDTDPCGDVVPCGINHLPDCSWEGLACLAEDDDISRIAGISIAGRSSHRLTGSLPLRLPLRLRSISLPGNDLNGNLFDPECYGAEYHCSDIWWRNEELTSINLEGNDLEGTLPEWSMLPSLENVQLSDNRFNGSLPASWSEKIYLNRIELSGNQLTGTLPEEWSSLIALQFLRLRDNGFHEHIPSEWLRLPSLVLLDVSGNCGMCGEVPEHTGFAIYGNGTNLNTDCSRCSGCQCKEGSLKFIVTNVLLAVVVFCILLLIWSLYQCLKPKRQPEQLPTSDTFGPVISRKPQEMPTIVINPDHGRCICSQIDETQHTTDSRDTESSDDDYDISEGDSSDYELDSDTESLDPELLAFLYKKSPMLALADRTWSEEIAGPSEVRQEGYASDLEARVSSRTLRSRRTKSAFEGRSVKNISKGFLEARKSAKRVTELAPVPKRPKNKHRRRRVRTFRRRNCRGLTDLRISEQESMRIPEEVSKIISSMEDASPDPGS